MADITSLSFAIPSFGDGPFLSECLDSISKQSVSTRCVVCAGDSTFPFEDQRWSWVTHIPVKPDPGMADCWSVAATECQAEYIAFLSDDNAVESKFAELVISFMDTHPHCDAVFSNQSIVNEHGVVDVESSNRLTARYGRHRLRHGLLNRDDSNYLFRHNCIPIDGLVIRRQIWATYAPFPREAYGAIDMHLATYLLATGATLGFLPFYLVRYRTRHDSYTTRRKVEHLRGAIWAMQNIQPAASLRSLVAGRGVRYQVYLLALDIPYKEKIGIVTKAMLSASGVKMLLETGGKYLCNVALRGVWKLVIGLRRAATFMYRLSGRCFDSLGKQ